MAVAMLAAVLLVTSGLFSGLTLGLLNLNMDELQVKHAFILFRPRAQYANMTPKRPQCAHDRQVHASFATQIRLNEVTN